MSETLVLKTGGLKATEAGAHAHLDVPQVLPSATISEIRNYLEKNGEAISTFNYIYVIDEFGKLQGVFSIKEVFMNAGSVAAEDIMVTDLVLVNAKTDQEAVAAIALEYSIKAVPVVDENHHFLGAVTSDQILEILHEESIEDDLVKAGLSGVQENPSEVLLYGTAWSHFLGRLPWLLLGVGGGIAAVFVVSHFEEVLATHVIIAAFIPAVVYIADAVGSQTQTIFIRALALEKGLSFWGYFGREFLVNISIGTVLSFCIFGVMYIFTGSEIVALVLSLSIFITVLLSMASSLFIPYIFQRLRFDPAIASGPLATIIRDLLSLAVYFAIVSLLI